MESEMPLTVVSVAYPFAPVAGDTPGGAEQVLSLIDRELVARGHGSIVLAQRGSSVAGTLEAVPAPENLLNEQSQTQTHSEYASALSRLVARPKVDVVHMHGLDFDAYLPPNGPAILVTLHLPIAWYRVEAFQPARPNVYFHCVSSRQHQDARGVPNLLPPIENGIDIGAYNGQYTKRNFALMLTRVCAEKGIHLALDAARRADSPLLIGGRVFPYAEHQQYFATEVKPRLDGQRKFIGQVGPARKHRFLCAARCLLIASTVPETSSLVAREAMAAGTPVVAFRRGALIDLIEHGRNGFLVDTVEEMADAIGRAAEIDPNYCRTTAHERFGSDRMIEAYLETYGRIAAHRR
jgi:glycosyltransferase involved in cell wall biosynthesis